MTECHGAGAIAKGAGDQRRDRPLCGTGQPKALSLGLNVFINTSLQEQAKERLAELGRRIAEHDEVMVCCLTTGTAIRVAVADIGALEKFILHQLTPIPGLKKIRSSFALKQVRYRTALPLLGRSPSAERIGD